MDAEACVGFVLMYVRCESTRKHARTRARMRAHKCVLVSTNPTLGISVLSLLRAFSADVTTHGYTHAYVHMPVLMCNHTPMHVPAEWSTSQFMHMPMNVRARFDASVHVCVCAQLEQLNVGH